MTQTSTARPFCEAAAEDDHDRDDAGTCRECGDDGDPDAEDAQVTFALRCSVCGDAPAEFWIGDQHGDGLDRPCGDCVSYAVRVHIGIHETITVQTREHRVAQQRAAQR